MRESLRNFWAGVKRWIRELAESFATIGIVAAVAAMFCATYVLIVLTATQVSVAVGSPPLLKTHTDRMLQIAGLEAANLRNDQYIGILSSAIGAVAVLVTLWFSVATLVSYMKQSRDLSRQSVIRKEAVRLDGEDDLEIMLKYFKHADAVTVFSGDFSWLRSNVRLLEHVKRLASERKISFVSYKSQGIVQNAVGPLFENLAPFFVFDSECRLKCSLVAINQSRVFLYKVDRTFEGGEKSVCIVSSKDDARYLLDALGTLCGRYATAASG